MEEKIILHCMTESQWNEVKDLDCWGKDSVERFGFVHCSTVEYFWRVAPNFSDVTEPMVLVLLDENRLIARVKYEDGDNCGRAYPHVYGTVNNEAVVGVLPFLRDGNGNYLKNPEFSQIEEK